MLLCYPHRATLICLNREIPLKWSKLTSPDILACMSLLIAALSAKGKTVIDNIDQIDRGYEDIDVRLRAIGADIIRA